MLCMASIDSTFVYICANSHDGIHVRLNENERMGTKKRVAGENVEEGGCRRVEKSGKNKENGIDTV